MATADVKPSIFARTSIGMIFCLQHFKIEFLLSISLFKDSDHIFSLWPSSSKNTFVHPSATPYSQCSCHRIIKFSGVITMDKSDGRAKRSEIKSQVHRGQNKFGHFQTVTPVWIHRWLQYDAQSLQWHRRGALLFFEVIRQISRSHETKKVIDFDPNWLFPDCILSLNSPITIKWCVKLEVA